MRGMSAVLQRDLRDLLRTNAFRLIAIVFAVVTIGAAVGACIGLNSWELLEQELPWDEVNKPMLEIITRIITRLIAYFIITRLIAYFISFFALVSFIWAFTSEPITKEKADGNIESLLATPLSPRALWIGKSRAVFLPGFITAVVSTLIVLLAVNFAVVCPTTGNMVWSTPVLLMGFLINPLLFLSLALLIVLVSLAYSPAIGLMLSMFLGWGLMFGMGIASGVGAINLASWSFTLGYLAGAIVIGAVAFYLSRSISREKIILSSKGE